MKTSIEWDDELSNPDSELAKQRMAELQAELERNAALAEGQSINVVGLRLCPPSGCDRRREAGSDNVWADVEIRSDCDEANEGECEERLSIVGDTKSAICADNECELTDSEISSNPEAGNVTGDNDSGASQLSYLLSLFTVSILFLIN